MGADGFNGLVEVRVDLKQMPDAAYDSAVSKYFELLRRFSRGGANDADCVYGASGSLAGAATLDVDLQTVLDAFGDALSATGVVVFLFAATSTNVDDIRVSPSAAGNPWTGLLAAGSEMKLTPGCTILGVATSVSAASRWTVGAGSKVVRLTNMSAGTAAGYTILFATFTS